MRDLQFADLHLFTRVADLGTLSAVARERDVPVELEVGDRLADRTLKANAAARSEVSE